MLLKISVAQAQSTQDLAQQLQQSAKHQEQLLVDKYGELPASLWQQRCEALLLKLELVRLQRCRIIKAPFANAYALFPDAVVLTQGLLQQINNDDQLAHVLAHEHAHLQLEHFQLSHQMLADPPVFFTKSKLKKHHRQMEQAADDEAEIWLLKHQLDPLQIHHLWLRLEQIRDTQSAGHLKLQQRIQRDDLPMESIEPWWSESH